MYRGRENGRKYAENGVGGPGWWVLITGNLTDILMWNPSQCAIQG